MKAVISVNSKVLYYTMVTIIIIFGSSLSFGYSWEKTFDGGDDATWGNCVQQTTDGGFIVVGDSYDDPGAHKIYLLKTDSAGNEQWSKIFWGAPGNSVQQTTDGGYIITGGYGYGDALLLKTDAGGEELWRKLFGGSSLEWGYDVQQTTDDGYIIVGSTYSYGAGGRDVYLIKTDADGNEHWSKTFGGIDDDVGNSVQQTTDGGFIIVGFTESFGAGKNDVYLIKTDADGNEIWSKTFDGSEYDEGRSVQQTTDSGYIVAGYTQSFGTGGADVFLIKTEADGNELWSKKFGLIDAWGWGNIVQQTTDGGYVIVSSALIKTDSDGNEQWIKSIKGNYVQQTTDGGFIITGSYDPGDGWGLLSLIYYSTYIKNLSYTPITPCRIVDTRKTPAGIIGADTQRDFHVHGEGSTISAQGGNSDGCPASLGEPVAAHINLVVANPTGGGNMQAFPVVGTSGANLGVNFADIGSNRANAGIIETSLGPGSDITVTSRHSSAHAIIDVLGYYYPDGDLLYTPVTPCRIVDTRKAGEIIGAYTERDFHVYGDSATITAQGGDASGCLAPMGEPLAAHINLVAACPSGKGNMQAYPVSGAPGANLGVNFANIGTNFANTGTVETSLGAGPDITVTSRYSSVHSVIEVLGYYYSDGDFTYTPVTPCRIVDTRKTSAGMIGASTQRDFYVYGDSSMISSQGGNSTGCPAPSGEPLAAHINLVVANPTGQGNMQAFAVGGKPGANFSVNFADIETNFANAGTVQTSTGAGPDITVASNFSSAHTVIDVLGYYYSAP